MYRVAQPAAALRPDSPPAAAATAAAACFSAFFDSLAAFLSTRPCALASFSFSFVNVSDHGKERVHHCGRVLRGALGINLRPFGLPELRVELLRPRQETGVPVPATLRILTADTVGHLRSPGAELFLSRPNPYVINLARAPTTVALTELYRLAAARTEYFLLVGVSDPTRWSVRALRNSGD